MNNKRPLTLLSSFFAISVFLTFLFQDWLKKQGVDVAVLLAGNAIIFLATILALVVYLRSLKGTTGGAAVRGMYGSFMIKFFTCLVAAFAYIIIAKKDVNKPALITCMGLYIVYTVMEVAALQQVLRKKSSNTAGR